MMHLDLFSGIGGFALAVDTVWPDSEHIFCDNDPFCQQVLKKHWPNSKIYGDIRTFTNTRSKEQRGISDSERQEISKVRQGCDILTGGFPCQPFSQAGRRKGTEDDRHLWPEMFRVIREFNPTWIIAENVRGFLSIEQGVVFEQVCADLESEGYEVQPLIIPAVATGAPHRRDRIWFIAHAKPAGARSKNREVADKGGRASKNRGAGLRQTNREAGTGWFDTTNTNASNSKREFGWSEERGKVDGPVFYKGKWQGVSDESIGPSKYVANTKRTGHKRQEHQARQGSRYNRGTQSTGWSRNWTETAQRFCQLDDGLPYRLAGFGLGDTCAIMGYILLLRDNFYGKKAGTKTEETMFAMQTATTPKSFSKLLRGYGKVQEKEVLRCNMHGESNDERESKPWSLLSKSEKIQRKEMQRVWHNKLAEHPPYQRGLDRQCSCQFDDIVRELSSPIALAEWQENAKACTDILFNMWQESRGVWVLSEPLQALQKIWRSLTDKEIGSFRRHYYKRNDDRNSRLKALGNSIVPQIAIEIMKAIKESTHERI